MLTQVPPRFSFSTSATSLLQKSPCKSAVSEVIAGSREAHLGFWWLERSELADVEIRPASVADLLRSGMLASFVIRVGDPVRSLAVPAEGVVREGDGTMTVWSTKDSRRFAKRAVKTGLQQDGWTQILEGLQPTEIVVMDGAVFLSNKLLLGDAG